VKVRCPAAPQPGTPFELPRNLQLSTRHAGCPYLVGRRNAAFAPPDREKENAMTCITRILVPTDFSANSEEALASAKMLAGRFGASLHLLHAVDEPFTAIAFASEMTSTLPLSLRDEMIHDAEQRITQRLPADQKAWFRGSTEIVCGRPIPAILDAERRLGADLIVIGTHGRRGLSRLVMGSDAEGVVREASVPVVLVRLPARKKKPRGR
jgi:nucleotide-binding universal stress UspA family protein